jgi:hypothetical protein
MNESLVAAAEEVKKRAVVLAQEIIQGDKMVELRKLVAGLNTLEDLCGQPKTALSLFFAFSEEEHSVTISPEEFYDLDPLEAAKRYMKKLGALGLKSATVGQIVNAIREGGGDPGNEDKLRLSLARSTYEVAKIGDDRFGLVEVLGIKRERSGKKKRNGVAQDGAPASEQGDGSAPAPEEESQPDPDPLEV